MSNKQEIKKAKQAGLREMRFQLEKEKQNVFMNMLAKKPFFVPAKWWLKFCQWLISPGEKEFDVKVFFGKSRSIYSRIIRFFTDRPWQGKNS